MNFRIVTTALLLAASAYAVSRGGEAGQDGKAKTLTVAVVSSHSEFCDL